MPVRLYFYPVKKPPIDMNFMRRNWGKINESPIKHAGLLIRRIMRGSIRQVSTDKPSRPGTPPRSRDKARRFKMIYSVPYDAAGIGKDTAAVIGHFTFPRRRQMAPSEIHEWGRTVRVRVLKRNKRRKAWTRKQARAYRAKIKAGLIQPPQTKFTTRTIKYKQRKFAWPALVKAKAKILPLWRGRINAGTVKGK